MEKKISANENQGFSGHQKRKAFFSAAEIKKMLKAGNIVIGTERAMKNLKLGKVQKILMSSNCPAGVESNLSYYAGLSGAELHKLDYPNDELSVICKKPFAISVLALLKGASK
ncbi:ribosomal L7Ae/L30e/S12e/Gadd45 family protein [Candidatus Woesearchaeota archaeon]|nr:ribosomal L7Ae/L30e/S12e/Gadd45 family protein [Candidatus Woesearchaeota archaeon]